MPTQPGIARWNDHDYSPAVRNATRILPSSTLEGFFIAQLKKIKSNVD
jgi:16S rRNA (cytosine1407-C5)-methyltransferase